MNTKERNTTFDILKLISIVLIIAFYGITKEDWNGTILTKPYSDFNLRHVFTAFYSILGNVGVNLYICCTAYYFNKKEDFYNKETLLKSCKIYSAMLFISLFVAFSLALLEDKHIVRYIFPLTNTSFLLVSLYIFLMFTAPYLSGFAKSMKYKGYKDLLMILIIAMIVAPSNYILIAVYSYLFIAFFEKYPLDRSLFIKKIYVPYLLMLTYTMLTMSDSYNLKGLYKYSLQPSNIFAVLIPIFLIEYCKTREPFYDPRISRFTKLILYVYCMCMNALVIDYNKAIIKDWLYNIGIRSTTIEIILLTVLALAISVPLAILQDKVMSIFSNLLGAKLYRLIEKGLNKLRQ